MSAHEVYPNIYVGDLTSAHFWPGPKLAIREQPSEYIYHSMDDKQIRFVYGKVTEEILTQACDWLDKMMKRKIPLLVHCSGGLHRSALIVAYWLATRYPHKFNGGHKKLKSVKYRVECAYTYMRLYRTEIEPRPDWIVE